MINYKNLSNFNLRIIGERDLNKFRGFVCGEISRADAYPTFGEWMASTMFHLALSGIVMSYMAKSLNKLKSTFSKKKK